MHDQDAVRSVKDAVWDVSTVKDALWEMPAQGRRAPREELIVAADAIDEVVRELEFRMPDALPLSGSTILSRRLRAVAKQIDGVRRQLPEKAPVAVGNAASTVSPSSGQGGLSGTESVREAHGDRNSPTRRVKFTYVIRT